MCMYEECVWMGHIVPFLEKKRKLRITFQTPRWGQSSVCSCGDPRTFYLKDAVFLSVRTHCLLEGQICVCECIYLCIPKPLCMYVSWNMMWIRYKVDQVYIYIKILYMWQNKNTFEALYSQFIYRMFKKETVFIIKNIVHSSTSDGSVVQKHILYIPTVSGGNSLWGNTSPFASIRHYYILKWKYYTESLHVSIKCLAAGNWSKRRHRMLKV